MYALCGCHSGHTQPKLCKEVSEPSVPLAISTCGKLTYGIVKIHEYRVGIVLKSANESYAKLVRFIKRVESQNINLPTTELRANTDAITIQQRPITEIQEIGDIQIDLRDVWFITLSFSDTAAIRML